MCAKGWTVSEYESRMPRSALPTSTEICRFPPTISAAVSHSESLRKCLLGSLARTARARWWPWALVRGSSPGGPDAQPVKYTRACARKRAPRLPKHTQTQTHTNTGTGTHTHARTHARHARTHARTNARTHATPRTHARTLTPHPRYVRTRAHARTHTYTRTLAQTSWHTSAHARTRGARTHTRATVGPRSRMPSPHPLNSSQGLREGGSIRAKLQEVSGI